MASRKRRFLEGIIVILVALGLYTFFEGPIAAYLVAVFGISGTWHVLPRFERSESRLFFLACTISAIMALVISMYNGS